MIKVLLLIDTLAGGGIQRRFMELIKGLQQDEHYKLELIVLNNEILNERIFEYNIKIHFITRKSRYDNTLFYKFYKVTKEFNPDIIHSWHRLTSFYIIPSKILLRKKLINSQISDAPEKVRFFSSINFITKLNFTFSNLITANSEAGLKSYNAPLKKSICIYNGFDFERINTSKSEVEIRNQYNITTPLVIGMFANYSKYKDHLTFVRAALKIISSRNDVTFISAGKDLGTKSIIANQLLTDRDRKYIRLLSAQSDIESLVKIIDIGVLCTYTEGISNTILEYMAFGKPVIATIGGGTIEIVIDKETGFLISSKDEGALVDKINVLLKDTDLAKRMGQHGKETVQNKFNLKDKYYEYLTLYNKLKTEKV